MPIYTKTGDKGITSLFDGTRVKKNHHRMLAVGSIDELNSFIGITITQIKKWSVIKEILVVIQHDLFAIGAEIANTRGEGTEYLATKLNERVSFFERHIDEMTEKVPQLTNFILPGGSKVAAFFQYARTVTRRAEREIVSLSEKEQVHKSVLIYINRLSDLFFTMSRFINFKEGKKETIWRQ